MLLVLLTAVQLSLEQPEFIVMKDPLKAISGKVSKNLLMYNLIHRSYLPHWFYSINGKK